MNFYPNSIKGGNETSGSVSTSQAAPAGGVTVTLACTTPGVTLPKTVTIPAGQYSQNFKVQTSAVTSKVMASVTATLYGTTISQSFTINP
jgi:hypothetical protein